MHVNIIIRMGERAKVFLVLFMGILFIFGYCRADEKKDSCFSGIEFLGGYGNANLHEKERYQLIPVFVDFDFDLKPLFANTKFIYPGMLQFIEEPFLAYVFDPGQNMEVGNNFLLKIGLVPDTWKLQPYIKAGIGIVYMTQHTRQQGTQFNFNEYVGLGAHCFIRDNIGLTLECRYRHLSNADIKKPNRGIDTYYGLVGIAYRF